MYIFFLLMPLVYLTSNIYLFCRIFQTMKGLPVGIKIVITIIFWAIALSLFAMFMMRGNDLPIWAEKGVFRIGSAWLFFSCAVAIVLIIVDILSLFIPAINGNIWWALGAATLLFVGGNYNHRHPQIVPMDIKLEKPMKETLRIAVVSDLHLGYGTGKSALKEYVGLINSQKPDVIFIAGDLIDNSLRVLRHEHFEKELMRLQAPLGVYMAPGNHEYISNITESEEFIADTGITFLRDIIVTLACGVQIVLRDDAANKWRLSLEELYKGIDHNKPIILIDHQPKEIVESDAAGTDLHISGHTHHGQVWPGSLITDRLFAQSHGYRKWEHAHVWISSGLSLWGPPVRIGTKGDIAIITLSGAEE